MLRVYCLVVEKKKWRKQTTDQKLKLWRFTELYFSDYMVMSLMTLWAPFLNVICIGPNLVHL